MITEVHVKAALEKVKDFEIKAEALMNEYEDAHRAEIELCKTREEMLPHLVKMQEGGEKILEGYGVDPRADKPLALQCNDPITGAYALRGFIVGVLAALEAWGNQITH